MTNTLTNVIKTEQRRIQRLIDLMTTNEIGERASGCRRQTDETGRKAAEGCGRSDGTCRNGIEDHSKLGSLVVERRGNRLYCYEYFYNDGERVGKRYLGKPDSDAVREHCRLKFREELLRRLRKNQKLLESVGDVYLDYDPASVYSGMPGPCLRVSSEAYIDERYEELKAWACAEYQRNTAPFSKTSTYAGDGTRVRSKGECIVYNLLLDKGIPFRYDSMIAISDGEGYGKLLSPDFLVKCYDGSLVMIEHLGLLGEKRYALDHGDKCYWYMQKGFIPGKNFFVTSDDLSGGTDSAAIASVVETVERLFWGWS